MHSRLASMFRGGDRPCQMAWAVVVGLLAGVVTGGNLTFLALALFAAVLNLNGRLLAIAWACGCTIAWLFSGTLNTLGGLVYELTPLSRLVVALGDRPIVALLDWDRYAHVGGAVAAMLLALPTARIVWGYGRARLTKLGIDNCAPRRVLRPLVWLAVPVTILVAGVLPMWLRTRATTAVLLAQLSHINGAEVSAARIELSLLSGRLYAYDLEFADPANLDRNHVRIGEVRGQLGVSALLRGRLHFNELTLQRVDRHGLRRLRAKGTGAATVELLMPTTSSASPADDADRMVLNEYILDWHDATSQLLWLRDLLGLAENVAEGRSWHALAAAQPDAAETFDGVARSALGVRRPAVQVERMTAEHLATSWGLGRGASAGMTHFSSHAQLTDRPAALTLYSPQCSARVVIELSIHAANRRHRLTLTAADVPLDTLLDAASDSRVVVDRGLVSIEGQGWADAGEIDLPLVVEARQLSLQVNGDAPAAGLDPASWSVGLRQLGGLRAEARLSGPLSSPQLTTSLTQLSSQLKHQLRAAGEHDLVAAIDEQAERHRQPPAAPSLVPELAKDLHADATQALNDDGASDLPVAVPPVLDAPSTTMNEVASARASVAIPVRYPETATPYIPASAEGPALGPGLAAPAFDEPLPSPAPDMAATPPLVTTPAEPAPPAAVQEVPLQRRRDGLRKVPINLILGHESDRARSRKPAETDAPPPAASPATADVISPSTPATAEATPPTERRITRWARGLKEKLSSLIPKRKPKPAEDKPAEPAPSVEGIAPP